MVLRLILACTPCGAVALVARRGELLGLRWEDLNGNMLHIRRSYTILEGKPTISTPKTERGTRRVALSQDVLEVLQAHRERQLNERLFMGDAWASNDYMFTDELGEPVTPHALDKQWRKLKKQAEVPHARLHDMRHLHVSLLVKQGFDPRTIADRAGHVDPAFTMSHYSHMFEEQRQATAVSLTDLLKPKAATPREAN